MKDATPLTPLAHERNYIFKFKWHTIYNLRGPEKYNCTLRCNTRCHFTATTLMLHFIRFIRFIVVDIYIHVHLNKVQLYLHSLIFFWRKYDVLFACLTWLCRAKMMSLFTFLKNVYLLARLTNRNNVDLHFTSLLYGFASSLVYVQSAWITPK